MFVGRPLVKDFPNKQMSEVSRALGFLVMYSLGNLFDDNRRAHRVFQSPCPHRWIVDKRCMGTHQILLLQTKVSRIR